VAREGLDGGVVRAVARLEHALQAEPTDPVRRRGEALRPDVGRGGQAGAQALGGTRELLGARVQAAVDRVLGALVRQRQRRWPQAARRRTLPRALLDLLVLQREGGAAA
jgi:hypothetical protein